MADQCKLIRQLKSIGVSSKSIYRETYVPALCRSLEANPSAVVESQQCVQLVWARKLRNRNGVFAGMMLVMCVVCERRKSQSHKEISDRVTGSLNVSFFALEIFDSFTINGRIGSIQTAVRSI